MSADEKCAQPPYWMPESMRGLIGAPYHFCRLPAGHDGLHVNNEGRTWGRP